MNATEGERTETAEAPSRRRALLTGAGMAGAALAAWLGGSPGDVEARRNACQVRCGGDRRHCRIDCRDWGSAEKACKRACTKLRDACFDRCEYTPIRSRLAR